MAIVKASFTRRAADAKRFVRYIAHRSAGRPGRVAREIWDGQGTLDRLAAYELIDRHPEGRGTNYFRFAISPDPQREDTRRDLDIRAITARTMRALEDRLGRPVEWVAALHEEHADHRHAHVLAIVHGTVRSPDLRALAQEATAAAAQQRRQRDQEQQRGRQQDADRVPRGTNAAREPTGAEHVQRGPQLERGR